MLRLLGGFLFSLVVGAGVFVFLVILLILLTGPHTPLIPFAGLLAVVSVVACNVIWQRRSR